MNFSLKEIFLDYINEHFKTSFETTVSLSKREMSLFILHVLERSWFKSKGVEGN